jgi:hypothetical protein
VQFVILGVCKAICTVQFGGLSALHAICTVPFVVLDPWLTSCYRSQPVARRPAACYARALLRRLLRVLYCLSGLSGRGPDPLRELFFPGCPQHMGDEIRRGGEAPVVLLHGLARVHEGQPSVASGTVLLVAWHRSPFTTDNGERDCGTAR